MRQSLATGQHPHAGSGEHANFGLEEMVSTVGSVDKGQVPPRVLKISPKQIKFASTTIRRRLFVVDSEPDSNNFLILPWSCERCVKSSAALNLGALKNCCYQVPNRRQNTYDESAPKQIFPSCGAIYT